MYNVERDGVKKIPKYGRASFCNLNENELRKAWIVCVGKDTLSAWDFEWFTCRPVIEMKCFSTICRVGKEVTGEERSNNISSANNVHLCSRSPQ